MTGFEHSRIAWNSSRVRRECWGNPAGWLSISARPFRSAPAQKIRPRPVRMTQRTSGSRKHVHGQRQVLQQLGMDGVDRRMIEPDGGDMVLQLVAQAFE